MIAKLACERAGELDENRQHGKSNDRVCQNGKKKGYGAEHTSE